jgi:elongation factor P
VATIEFIQVRKGMVIVGEGGQLFTVVDRTLNTPGNWRAILHLKLKNLQTGAVTTERVHPDNKVEIAYLDHREMQYLYQDGNDFVFMDSETFDQVMLSKEWIGDQILYLRENDKAYVVFYEERPVSLELPEKVVLRVREVPPSIAGATAKAQKVPATMETGLVLDVPPFIEAGELIEIDTRNGEYVGRAK